MDISRGVFKGRLQKQPNIKKVSPQSKMLGLTFFMT